MMIKNNDRLFHGMPECCSDDQKCRELLKIVAARMKSIRRSRFRSSVNEHSLLQILKLYRELQSRNYSGAYSRLRHIGVSADLCSSEMTAILIPTLTAMLED